MSTYNASTYNELIEDIDDEVDEPQLLSTISPESIQAYILQGCQRISTLIPIKTQRELRLIVGQDDYEFADSTVPATGTGTVGVSDKDVTGVTASGTGTISTDGKDVTGVGTLFLTELAIGKMIVVGTEKKMVTAIDSNLACTLDDSFDTDLAASAFSYSTTKFTKEINEGSSIVVGGVTRIVDTITNGYQLTVTQAYTASQSAQAFTIDTVVTEIPTSFYGLRDCTRIEGTIPRKVEIRDVAYMNRRKQQDFGVNPYSNLQKPLMIVPWMKENGRKYLTIYPSVDADKQITLYGFLRVTPRTYSSTALTAYIPLQQDFDPMIKEFAKYRIYNKLKQKDNAAEASNEFDKGIARFIRNTPVYATMITEYK